MRSSKHSSLTKLAEGRRPGTNAGQPAGRGTTRKRPEPAPAPKGKDRVCTLDVFLISGPVSAKFARKNKTISRTIEIRGSQTLEELHEAVFEAFDREEDHPYEFQVGGQGPLDPNPVCR